jgi:hypothetical protein
VACPLELKIGLRSVQSPPTLQSRRERDQPFIVGSCAAELPMCWKCEQIDKQIDHYRGLCDRVADQGSVRSLEILIGKLEADKTGLHIVEFSPPSKTAPGR